MKEASQILKMFSLKRIMIPVVLGLGVTGYYMWKEISGGDLEGFQWSASIVKYILLAILLVFIRDLAYIYRLRHLAANDISWRASFQVIMLWEFASAVSPGIVGGSAPALFLVWKEGISMGRTTAIVMVTSLLDEMYYILLVPLVLVITGIPAVFPDINFMSGTRAAYFFFGAGYLFIIVLALIILFGIFVNPVMTRNILIRIFSIPFLKRWRDGAARTGDEIIISSQVMRKKPWSYWIKAFGATLVTWTARFLLVNVLVMAIAPVSNHVVLLGRQLVMWVILLISPTPGSSGAAEILFSNFLGSFISGYFSPGGLAVIWRLLSFYIYLVAGAIVLPVWLRRVYLKPKKVRRNG